MRFHVLNKHGLLAAFWDVHMRNLIALIAEENRFIFILLCNILVTRIILVVSYVSNVFFQSLHYFYLQYHSFR